MSVYKAVPFLLVVAILTAGWWVIPSDVQSIPLCFIKYFWHMDCPGCGLTRSFLSLARLNLVDSFRYNAAGPLIYLLFLAYGYERFFDLTGHPRVIRWPRWFVATYPPLVVLLLVVHWIVRLNSTLQ